MAKIATKSTKGGKKNTATKSNSVKSNGLEFAVEHKRTYSSFDDKAKCWKRFHQYIAVGVTAKQIAVIKQIKGNFYKCDDKGMPLFTATAPYGTKCTWTVSDCGKYIESNPSPERLRWEELRDMEERTPAQEKEFKALAREEMK